MPEITLPMLLTAAGAVVLVFLTPLGSKVVDLFFSKRPAFSVGSPVLDSGLLLVVKPANNAANKKLPLGVRVRGLNILNVADVQKGVHGLLWIVDLSKIDRIMDILKIGEDYDFQFFFKPDHPSENVTIRFLGEQPKKETGHIDKTIMRMRNLTDLASNIGSNSRIICEFTSESISRVFPTAGPHVEWKRVHDGKEVTFHNISNI